MSQFRDRRRTYYQQEFASSSVFAVLTIIGSYLVFTRVALQVVRGVLTVGDIVVFAGVSTRLRLTLERLVTTVSEVMEQAIHVANLRNFLHTLPRLTNNGEEAPATRRGAVELVDVFFTYPGSSTPALASISMHIKPGEIVGLVGESGAGRRRSSNSWPDYDPDRGAVRFDGIDVRDSSPVRKPWACRHQPPVPK